MAGLLRKWDRVHEEMREDSLTTTPKISVIIPVYNVEDYLRPCLDSMIDRPVKEIEIICVDDGQYRWKRYSVRPVSGSISGDGSGTASKKSGRQRGAQRWNADGKGRVSDLCRP